MTHLLIRAVDYGPAWTAALAAVIVALGFLCWLLERRTDG